MPKSRKKSKSPSSYSFGFGTQRPSFFGVPVSLLTM